ncbi:MAG TPA: addiction module protein [Thermoanaerobaculia bacterium]|nr:addiction module protein [Thermoanaerobaculia bacterium]
MLLRETALLFLGLLRVSWFATQIAAQGTPTERVQLADDLWESLAEEPEVLPLADKEQRKLK